jgi:hypothetical protein
MKKNNSKKRKETSSNKNDRRESVSCQKKMVVFVSIQATDRPSPLLRASEVPFHTTYITCSGDKNNSRVFLCL